MRTRLICLRSHFARAMDAKGFLDEQPFTVIDAAFELDLEGGA
jgi:hypothetical protein